MTTQDALDWINGGWRTSRFVRTIPGVGVGIDVDKLYGFQCKDFANGYADFMGAPFGSGNAIALWRETQPGWHKVATPQAGDVFVRNYIAGDGMNYGDTGIVKEVLGARIRVVQQNLAGNLWVGSPPAETLYSQNIMLGYLRNDKIGGNMSDIVTTAELPDMVRGYLFREPNADDNVHLGKTWQQAQADFIHSPQRGDVQRRYNSVPELQQQVKDLTAENEQLKKGFKEAPPLYIKV